jgi:hypothetical protein
MTRRRDTLAFIFGALVALGCREKSSTPAPSASASASAAGPK